MLAMVGADAGIGCVDLLAETLAVLEDTGKAPGGDVASVVINGRDAYCSWAAFERAARGLMYRPFVGLDDMLMVVGKDGWWLEREWRAVGLPDGAAAAARPRRARVQAWAYREGCVELFLDRMERAEEVTPSMLRTG